MTYDKQFYNQLSYLQTYTPEQYKTSGLCSVILSYPKNTYSIVPPQFVCKNKEDDGNANTRDRYIGILLKEFLNPVEKTENYRILYNKLAELYSIEVANDFLMDDVCGTIYTHNSQNIATKPYCFAYDFDKLVEQGAFFTDIADRPAQHLDSFIQHVIEFVAVTCRETTGAVGLPALFPYMWYYWNKDKETSYIPDADKYLEQQIQMLVYKLNGSEMRMNESAFTNVSIMDESYLEAFFGDRIFPDGDPVVSHIAEIVDFECFFLESVNKILAHKIMTFPVITDCLLYDDKEKKFVNEETARRFSNLNTIWNNANIYSGTDITTLSTCCRVLNNIESMNTKLRGHSNFIGGSDLNIGSVGVITLNLPQWALRSVSAGYTIGEAIEDLKLSVDNVCLYLHGVRECIKDLISKHALKLYDFELAKIERQFNTVGFIGLYDAAMIFAKDTKNESKDSFIFDFEKLVLQTFKSKIEEFETQVDYSINLEQIPGESACVKLAKKDRMLYPLADLPDCYSNQWLPLTEYYSINDRASYAAELDKMCGGGSILHINLDAPFTNTEQAWKLLNDIAAKGVIYFAFNNRISVDEHEHGFYGNTCWCGAAKVGEATRPVGFITLVKNWIPSRQEEYKRRTWMEVE